MNTPSLAGGGGIHEHLLPWCGALHEHSFLGRREGGFMNTPSLGGGWGLHEHSLAGGRGELHEHSFLGRWIYEHSFLGGGGGGTS